VDNTASTNPGPAHGDEESPLHEGSNIPLRPMIKFTIGFVVVLVVVHVVILSIFFAFRSAAAQERQITGVEEARIVPPPPRLQPSVDHNELPVNDLRAMHAHETEVLKLRGLLDEEGKPQFSEALVKQIAAQAVTKK